MSGTTKMGKIARAITALLSVEANYGKTLNKEMNRTVKPLRALNGRLSSTLERTSLAMERNYQPHKIRRSVFVWSQEGSAEVRTRYKKVRN